MPQEHYLESTDHNSKTKVRQNCSYRSSKLIRTDPREKFPHYSTEMLWKQGVS